MSRSAGLHAGNTGGDDFDLADDVEMDVKVKLGDCTECFFSTRHATYLKHFLSPDHASAPAGRGSGGGSAPASMHPTSSAFWTAGAAVGSLASTALTASSSFFAVRSPGAGGGASQPGAGGAPSAVVCVALSCGTRAAGEAVNDYYRLPPPGRGEVLVRLQSTPALILQVLELCHRLESHVMFLDVARLFGRLVQGTVDALKKKAVYPPTSADQLQRCSVELQRTFGLPEESEAIDRLNELVSYFDPKLPMQSPLTHSVTPELFAQMRMQRQATAVNDHDGFAKRVLNLDPFRQRVWQPDSEAPTCPGNKSSPPGCGKTFPTALNAWLSAVTAEHCRCCGLRKCSTCTSYLVDRSIARVVKPGSNDSENAAQQRRACRDCYFQALELTKYLFLCRTFVFAQLTVPLVSLMRCVNKQWRSAAELCLNEYRNHFYFHVTAGSEPSLEFSELVRNTAGLMDGHPLLVRMYFHVMDWANPQEVATACALLESTLLILADRTRRFPTHSHWQLLCTRECAVTSKEVFALQVLLTLQRVPARYALWHDGDPPPQAAALEKIQQLLVGALAGLDRVHVCTAMTPLLLDVVTVKPCQKVCVPVLYKWVTKLQWIATVLIQEVACRPRNPTLEALSTCPQGSRVPSKQGALLQSIDEPRRAPFVNAMKALEAIIAAFAIKKPATEEDAKHDVLRQLIAAGLVVGDDAVRNGGVPLLNASTVTVLRRFTFFFDARESCDIVGIRLGETVVMSSQIRPIILTFVDVNHRPRRVMFKAENLRRDFVVCTGAALLQDIIADADPVDSDVRNIPRYRVLPLTNEAGLVEMVDECQTVQKIHGFMPSSEQKLLRFLLDHVTENVKRMRPSSVSPSDAKAQAKAAISPAQEVGYHFLRSARFFILVNYVFAIGDRHRDNVMVSIRDGSIFHIDFGMIMNTKTFAESLTTQYVRFDNDIVECIDAFAVAAAAASSSGGKAGGAKGSAAAGVHHMDPRGPGAASASPPLAPLTPQQERDERRYKALADFLESTGSWFISVRPHSPLLFLMLGHLVRHGVLADGSGVSAAASSSPATCSPSLPLRAARISSEEQLSRELRSIFVAGCTESEAREIFKGRVSESVGKHWLKDLTYDTRKRATSMYTDLTARLWSYWTPAEGRAPSRRIEDPDDGDGM